MDLPFEDYAASPTARFQRTDTEQALRNVLGYRLYLDLRRGWRITSPNLEQCGLLEIKYKSLEELAEADDEDLWSKYEFMGELKDGHPILRNVPIVSRQVVEILL